MSGSGSALPRSVVVTMLSTAGCVFAEEEADLLISAARTRAELHANVTKRIGGLPLEHILGWAEFCGLRIAVDPGVFVPRHRTEFLVAEAAARCRPGAVVVDLCCGSGAVGVALAVRVESIELYATDLDPAAVRCARRNLAGGIGQVFEGDLTVPLPSGLRGRVDVLVANTPYVPTGEIERMPHEARTHEARLALDGGMDGLDVQRRVAATAPDWLAPGGCLLVETSREQASHSADIFAGNGLDPIVAISHEFEATVVIGTLV
ncbi:MAG: putative protein N(5)-glutamine methyltransferase [Acidimicrobiia bacterium]|nr:putative protein N(5)-glutamine methyltransferase [Acidimicrobiia bacterium]